MTCPNTCLEVGASAREKLVALASAQKQGLEQRQRLVSHAAQTSQQWRTELDSIAAPLAAQEAALADLTAKKDTAEADAATQATPPPAETTQPEEQGSTQQQEQAAQAEEVPAEETDEERGRRIARQWTNDVRDSVLLLFALTD